MTEPILGQIDVDLTLAFVVHDERISTRSTLSGRDVALADELVEAFAATLVARPQPPTGRSVLVVMRGARGMPRQLVLS